MIVEERLSEAWLRHRTGDHSNAITVFNEILEKRPRYVDAFYGLGLAKRGMGDLSGAREAFEVALKIADETLNSVDNTSTADGHTGTNDLLSSNDDRYMMLIKMLNQRLDELEALTE